MRRVSDMDAPPVGVDMVLAILCDSPAFACQAEELKQQGNSLYKLNDYMAAVERRPAGMGSTGSDRKNCRDGDRCSRTVHEFTRATNMLTKLHI